MPRPTQNDKRQQTGRIPGQLERVQRQTPGVYETPETLDVSQQGQIRFGANAQSAFRTDESLAGQLLKQLRPITEIVTAIDKDRTRQDRELAEDLQMTADKIISNDNLTQKDKLRLLQTQYSQAKPKTRRFEAIFSNQAAGAQAKVNELNDEDFLISWITKTEEQNLKNPVFSTNPDIPSKAQFRKDAVEDAIVQYPHLRDKLTRWEKGTELKALQDQFKFIQGFALSQATNELNMLALHDPDTFTGSLGGVQATVNGAVFSMAKENGIPVELIRDNPAIMEEITSLVKAKTQDVQNMVQTQSNIATAQANQESAFNSFSTIPEAIAKSKGLNPQQVFAAWKQGRQINPALAPGQLEFNLYGIRQGIQDIANMQFDVAGSDMMLDAILAYHPLQYKGEEVRALVKQMKEDPSSLDMEFRQANATLIQKVLDQTSNLYMNDFYGSLTPEENAALALKVGKVQAMMEFTPYPPSPNADKTIRDAQVERALSSDDPTDYEIDTQMNLKNLVEAKIEMGMSYGIPTNEAVDLQKELDKASFGTKSPTPEMIEARNALNEKFGDSFLTAVESAEDAQKAGEVLKNLDTGIDITKSGGGQIGTILDLVNQRITRSINSVEDLPQSQEGWQAYFGQTQEKEYEYDALSDPIDVTINNLRAISNAHPQFIPLRNVIDDFDNAEEGVDKYNNFMIAFDDIADDERLKDLEVGDPLSELSLNLTGTRKNMLKAIGQNLGGNDYPLYDFNPQTGMISLTKDNTIAVPFLLSDAVSQYANNNGKVNNASAEILADRMEQVAAEVITLDPEARAEWFKKNINTVVTLQNLATITDSPLYSNKKLKKSTFAFIGGVVGLKKTTSDKLAEADPKKSPRLAAIARSVQANTAMLLQGGQDLARAAGYRDVLEKSVNLVTNFTEVPVEDMPANQTDITGTYNTNEVPYDDIFYNSDRDDYFLFDIAGGDIWNKIPVIGWADPVSPFPTTGEVQVSPLLMGWRSRPAMKGEVAPIDQKEIRDLTNEAYYDIIGTIDQGRLFRLASESGKLEAGVSAALAASDGMSTTAMSDPLMDNLLEVGRNMGYQVILSPMEDIDGDREKNRVLTEALGEETEGENATNFSIQALPIIRSTYNDNPPAAIEPLRPNEKQLEVIQNKLGSTAEQPNWAMLEPQVIRQQAMLGAVPAPGNSGETLMGQVVTWGLPEEDQRRIGKILDKTLYERGEGRGPLTKVRTKPGDVRKGYAQTPFSAEVGGGSYLGLHNSVATVTYLHKMLIEDPENFDSVLRDLEKDLELTDIQISEETGNNIVAFSEYNENSGEYIFYHKNGKDGKLVLNATATDREAGILDPKALLKLVIDGGIRHFEGLSHNVTVGGTGEIVTDPRQPVEYTFYREDNYVQNEQYRSLSDYEKIVLDN